MDVTKLKIDTFTNAYIEAILFTEDDENEQSLNKNYSINDFSHEAMAQILEDCRKFQEKNSSAISSNLKRAGHDFWLTRNGHGSGFWDGDWDDEDGKVLTASAKSFGEIWVYIGDDGLLYFTK